MKPIIYLTKYNDQNYKWITIYNIFDLYSNSKRRSYREYTMTNSGRIEDLLVQNSKAWTYYNIYNGKQIKDIKAYIRRHLKDVG